MQQLDGRWVFSATDLVARMECEHRTGLDLAYAAGLLVDIRPAQPGGMLAAAGDHGMRHELRVLADLTSRYATSVEIPRPSRSRAAYADAAAQTQAALDQGVDLVYQACFFDGAFVGFADFVVRGEHGYEAYDAKLARSVKPGALLQLAAYSEQLHRLGHPMPQQMHVFLGDTDRSIASCAVDDVLPKLRQIRADLNAQIGRGPGVPDPIWADRRPACTSCRWTELCELGRDEDRDLSLVAGMRADQRRKLQDAGVMTLEQLAAARDDQRPDDLGESSFERLRAQAALQAQQDATRTPADPDGEVSTEFFSHDGIRLLPPTSDGDVWFDMEGDPFAEQGRGLEYLFGYTTIDDASPDDPRYTAIWAHTPDEEKRAFEDFVDRMQRRIQRWPDMHIYHYATYERAALRRLAGQHGTREHEIDEWLRKGRLVDLMKVFKGSFRVSQRSYSIKRLEPLYGLVRSEDVQTAGDSVVDYEAYLELIDGDEPAEAQAKLDGIADYNRVDCESTLRLDRWLRPYADSSTVISVLDPAPPSDGVGEGWTPPDVEDAAYDRLLKGVPDEDRSPRQQAQAMARAAVSYYRRENKPLWWEHYNRLDAAPEEWETDWEVVVVDRAAAEPWTLKQTRRHRCIELTLVDAGMVEFPPQSPVYLVYDEATDAMHSGNSGGRGWTEAVVQHHDGTRLTVSESAPMDSTHVTLPVAVFPQAAVRDACLARSTREYADRWRPKMGIVPGSPVTDLLLRRSPRLRGGVELPRTGDPAADVEQAVRLLDESYLAVQGPPGSGKTHLAAQVICSLVASGWRIGVVAQSHKAIENVLDKAVDMGLSPDRIAKKCRAGHPPKPYHRSKPERWLDGHVGGALIGGTAWQFCSVGMTAQAPLDLLIIDEAGQYSLGFTVSLWQAAQNMLLLGDPQQLPQVTKGTHPEPVDMAALSWLADGEPVLPARFGYFLSETRRMSEAVTQVVSRLSYARQLRAHPDALQRRLVGVEPGVHPVPVQHADRTVHAPEEVAAVVELVRRHVGRQWVDTGGKRPLGQADVLVVAPFNAQVDAIRKALRAAGLGDVPVGTVDKFQGQEAPVVIVSMTASSREEVPRGMGFVLSRNRLNVAISRGQWASYVVHSPALADHSPGTSGELVLLGAFLGVVS